MWFTLELHGNYSVEELKRHCNIHLVFLEGGILGQLHKKPKIPKLMGTSFKSSGPQVVVIEDDSNDNVKHGQSSNKAQDKPVVVLPDQVTELEPDHTYASPKPQVRNEVTPDTVENYLNSEP